MSRNLQDQALAQKNNMGIQPLQINISELHVVKQNPEILF